MTREEIVAFFECRQQALNRFDAAALAALHTEEGVLDSVMGHRVSGRHAIEQFYANLFTSFPDFRYVPEELIIDGERVVQVATFDATHNGTFMGMPATGRRVRVPGIFLFTLRDGRIERLRSVYDFTGLLVQAGVLKVKPA
jgi:steroid delta-isomerase-like uncharacterized protein